MSDRVQILDRQRLEAEAECERLREEMYKFIQEHNELLSDIGNEYAAAGFDAVDPLDGAKRMRAEIERLKGVVTGSALAVFSNAEKEIDKLRETLHRIAYEYMTPEELRKTSDVECLGFEEVLSMAYENIQSEARAVLDED